MTKSCSKKRGKRGQKPIPLAPPPAMRSRKRARVVTTTFHKLTRDRDQALKRGDLEEAKRCDKEIAANGGRLEYQRASQLSTSYHSTSRWVLGHLARCGWLYGIVQEGEAPSGCAETKKKQKAPRRQLRLLEVGAINTELLDAATQTKTVKVKPKEQDGDTESNESETGLSLQKEHMYRLDVRAIDLHSCHEGIEEADFLMLPFTHKNPAQRYDVVVCSMVINCVTTPQDRGLMLARLFHHLRPGGKCFLVLPKLCLIQSPYMTPERFCSLLSKDGVGFEVVETKESPKVSFFILQRPKDSKPKRLDPKWQELTIVRRGKKFRNQFGVVLNEKDVVLCGEPGFS